MQDQKYENDQDAQYIPQIYVSWYFGLLVLVSKNKFNKIGKRSPDLEVFTSLKSKRHTWSWVIFYNAIIFQTCVLTTTRTVQVRNIAAKHRKSGKDTLEYATIWKQIFSIENW